MMEFLCSVCFWNVETQLKVIDIKAKKKNPPECMFEKVDKNFENVYVILIPENVPQER